MTDLWKGIIVGVVAVKILESDTVQNAIKRATKKKIQDVSTKITEAVFAEKKPEPLKDEKICRRDEDGKPIAGRYSMKSDSNYKIVMDTYGKFYKIPNSVLRDVEVKP
jgi:hypothetical protein